MKAILFGAILGILLLWPAALSLTAQAVTALAQPAIVAFVLGVLAQPAIVAFALGVLAQPAIVRRVRRWSR